MRIVLFILSIPAFGFGVLALAYAKSAVHEIEAGIGFLVWATFLVGASICDAIVSHSEKLQQALGGLETQVTHRPASDAPLQARSVSADDAAFRRWREESKGTG